MPDCKACFTFEFRLRCLLLMLRYGGYVSLSWILPWACWFGVMNGNVSQQGSHARTFSFTKIVLEYSCVTVLRCCCAAIRISSSLQPFWFQRPILWKTIFPPLEVRGMVSGWFKCVTFIVNFISVVITSAPPQIIKPSIPEVGGPLHTYVHSFFWISFPFRPPQSKQSSLCYAVGSQEAFHLKNGPVISRMESRLSEESSGLRWYFGLMGWLWRGQKFLHVLI